jgi:hypothetical protein
MPRILRIRPTPNRQPLEKKPQVFLKKNHQRDQEYGEQTLKQRDRQCHPRLPRDQKKDAQQNNTPRDPHRPAARQTQKTEIKENTHNPDIAEIRPIHLSQRPANTPPGGDVPKRIKPTVIHVRFLTPNPSSVKEY